MPKTFEYFLVNDVAKAGGVATATARYWARVGKIPTITTPGGVRLFRRDDVAAYLAARVRARR